MIIQQNIPKNDQYFTVQNYGFELPPEYIIPSGLETWEGFKVVLDEVIANDIN